MALLRSVSVNLAELHRAGALVRSEPRFARLELPPSPRLRRTCRRVAYWGDQVRLILRGVELVRSQGEQQGRPRGRGYEKLLSKGQGRDARKADRGGW